MKFQKGQMVRVKRDFKDHSKYDELMTPGISDHMRDMAGKTYKVSRYYGDRVVLNGWQWREEWLEPVVEDKNEAFNMLVRGEIDSTTYQEVISSER